MRNNFLRNHTLLLSLVSMFTCGLLLGPMQLMAQQSPIDPLSKEKGPNPSWISPTVDPSTAFLFGLERKFAAAVAEGGGAAFASFFDKNGVTLGNRSAVETGQAAIAAQANWSPKDYQLTWTPEGGQMSPSGDMGFTWGFYEGRTLKGAASDSPTHGRYMTVWKKESDGTWKVVLDSSNEDAPNAAACTCTLDAKP